MNTLPDLWPVGAGGEMVDLNREREQDWLVEYIENVISDVRNGDVDDAETIAEHIRKYI